jgi:ferredoxin
MALFSLLLASGTLTLRTQLQQPRRDAGARHAAIHAGLLGNRRDAAADDADPGQELYGAFSKLYSVDEDSSGSSANKEDPSHMHLKLVAETGEPEQARFTYVDEHSCIGCTYCNSVARNTFFMEEEFGRARVYDQAGDSDELIQEAIDTCPVNCIHFVSIEDLVTLETSRTGQEINNKQRLVVGQEFAPTTFRTTSLDAIGVRCENCPSKGCKDCPMFGIGENPVYLQRQAEREERRRRTGKAAEEKERARREELIGGIFETTEPDE